MEDKEEIKGLPAENSAPGEVKRPAIDRNPVAPTAMEALKKCLEQNNGDRTKCQRQIMAFQSPDSELKPKPLFPLRLRSGSLTDV